MRVIAYTYEADYHCIPCATTRFGEDDFGYVPEDVEDGEGNPIGAVFSTDDWYANAVYMGDNEAVLSCGTCLEEIERITLDD